MRTFRAHLTALFAASSLLIAACGSSSDSGADAAGTAEGPDDAAATELLAFEAQSLDGDEFTGTSVEGRDVVFWFWAPWCTICRAEAPDILAAASAFDGQVEIIGVAGRGEAEEMQAFVADTGTGELDHIIDDDGSIWSGFGVSAQPAFAFIDDGGEVEVFAGSLGEAALKERMQALAEA